MDEGGTQANHDREGERGVTRADRILCAPFGLYGRAGRPGDQIDLETELLCQPSEIFDRFRIMFPQGSSLKLLSLSVDGAPIADPVAGRWYLRDLQRGSMIRSRIVNAGDQSTPLHGALHFRRGTESQ